MKQATLIEIAESCKINRSTAYHWAVKAGKKISSIGRKLAAAGPHNPAVFNEDELICILGENYVKITPTKPDIASSEIGQKDSLQMQQKDSLQMQQKDSLQMQQRTKPTLDQKLKISELIVRMMELSERTRPNMQLDYHLNIAKKRLSGLAANDKYTPAMNLLEAPNNEEE